MKIRIQKLAAYFIAVLALALATLVIAPSTVRGQWTSPDVNGNISNTNTGKVGIGTASPAQTLEIKSTGGTRARITMANGTSGGIDFFNSGGTFKGGVFTTSKTTPQVSTDPTTVIRPSISTVRVTSMYGAI